MRKLTGKFTYANVVSTICLVFVLGMGSAWAASKLGANTVGSKQIKDNSVANTDLAPDAVTTDKVADGSLLSGDFAAGQLPTGPQGPDGTPLTTLFAYVGSAGNLISGHGAVSASPFGNGQYRVDFDRDLTNCVSVVNAGVPDPAGDYGSYGFGYGAQSYITTGTGMKVVTFSRTAERDSAFEVVVFC